MVQLRRYQLALFNGQDKPRVYVAYKGDIYDVTDSRHWKTGIHYEHWAGQDLTEEISKAPHKEEVFHRFPCIGHLVD
jgi:predicted heme/steroid binding protein